MKYLMRSIIIFLICCLSLVTAAQQQSHQEDINTQAWTDFIKGFNEHDNSLFSSVHSKDFIRVIRDNQQIFGFDKAFEEKPEAVKSQLAKWKRNLELLFIERIASVFLEVVISNVIFTT